ncbi:hypothetical protein Glove_355g7 [Diversispora epigaea]|uniref:Uncharacterized protein n=1 Tax=Diversispora epigaea TaxID=1348612 RepID=A0A397HFH2_9GLOM|nr:hypothetical protein Glove_355g7 [Diversispora epigaea]
MEPLIKKYYRAGASPEAIEEIRQSRGKIPNARQPDCIQQKNNTINWNKEIENIYNLYAELPY